MYQVVNLVLLRDHYDDSKSRDNLFVRVVLTMPPSLNNTSVGDVNTLDYWFRSVPTMCVPDPGRRLCDDGRFHTSAKRTRLGLDLCMSYFLRPFISRVNRFNFPTFQWSCLVYPALTGPFDLPTWVARGFRGHRGRILKERVRNGGGTDRMFRVS